MKDMKLLIWVLLNQEDLLRWGKYLVQTHIKINKKEVKLEKWNILMMEEKDKIVFRSSTLNNNFIVF